MHNWNMQKIEKPQMQKLYPKMQKKFIRPKFNVFDCLIVIAFVLQINLLKISKSNSDLLFMVY